MAALAAAFGSALRFQPVKLVLVLLPRRMTGLPDGGHDERQCDQAQGEEELRKRPVHYSTPATCTHGGTMAQPGPRKNVPTTISTRLTTMNTVKIQMAHFRSAGRRLGFGSR